MQTCSEVLDLWVNPVPASTSTTTTTGSLVASAAAVTAGGITVHAMTGSDAYSAAASSHKSEEGSLHTWTTMRKKTPQNLHHEHGAVLQVKNPNPIRISG